MDACQRLARSGSAWRVSSAQGASVCAAKFARGPVIADWFDYCQEWRRQVAMRRNNIRFGFLAIAVVAASYTAGCHSNAGTGGNGATAGTCLLYTSDAADE